MSDFYQPTPEHKKQSAERIAAKIKRGLPVYCRGDGEQRERFLEAERETKRLEAEKAESPLHNVAKDAAEE